MQIAVGGIQCEYQMHRAQNSGDTVLFLHGWGGDIRSFAGAYRAVCGWEVSCVNFAFPKTVPEDWGIFDYAECVKEFLIACDIREPIIVGHSFGGRVAMILAAQGLCKKLVLVDSAGLKPRYSIRKKLKIAKYRRRVKCGKPLDGCGSTDYNSLAPEMRGVFVRIVNTHLDRLMPQIQCKTLIFWGRNDSDTPPYMAKRLKRGIKNSELVFSDGGHYAYVDAHYEFISILKSFVTE